MDLPRKFPAHAAEISRDPFPSVVEMPQTAEESRPWARLADGRSYSKLVINVPMMIEILWIVVYISRTWWIFEASLRSLKRVRVESPDVEELG